MSIRQVIAILKNSPRMGSFMDGPEGSRYIQISETLVDQMIAHLERVEQDRIDALRYVLVLDRQWQTGRNPNADRATMEVKGGNYVLPFDTGDRGQRLRGLPGMLDVDGGVSEVSVRDPGLDTPQEDPAKPETLI